MRRFTLASEAEYDIDAIADYLAEQNIELGRRFYHAVRSTLQGLAESPGEGRLREFETRDLAGVRSWPIAGFKNHLAFYIPTDDGVLVLRVMHAARDIDAQFTQP